MPMINCPECGKEISDKAFSCPNCGYVLNENIATANLAFKRKIPGRGFGISGMIMGILGVIYSPLILMSTSEIRDDVMLKQGSIIMGIYIAIFGILALAFGFSSRARGYKKGQSTAAIVMGLITLVFCIATIVISILA